MTINTRDDTDKASFYIRNILISEWRTVSNTHVHAARRQYTGESRTSQSRASQSRASQSRASHQFSLVVPGDS